MLVRFTRNVQTDSVKNIKTNLLTKKKILRNLKTSDPKAYWKMLNKSDGSGAATAQKLSLEAYAEHLKKKKLNTVSSEVSDTLPLIDSEKVSEHNSDINSPITEQEVLKSINRLKLNKACASDLILSAFVKFSKTKMLTVFTKLFNIVFPPVVYLQIGHMELTPLFIRIKVIKIVQTVTGG